MTRRRARARTAGRKAVRERIWTSWFVFLGAFFVLEGLLAWAGEQAWRTMSELTAKLTATTLRCLGTEAYADGRTVRSSLYTVTIIRGCTGVHQIVMFASGVIAFPSSVRAKVLGILWGIVATLLVTQVRVVSLCYVGRFFPVHFEFAHMVFWQSLVVIITVFLWTVWAVRLTEEHDPNGP